MAQIILNVSDETLEYFKRFKLTNIGDNKNIDTITEAIKKSTDYKSKLKADMVAMLVELQLEIEEKATEICDDGWWLTYNWLIQEKINELKEESEESCSQL